MISRKSIANDRASTDRHPVLFEHGPHSSVNVVGCFGRLTPPKRCLVLSQLSQPAQYFGNYLNFCADVNAKKTQLAEMAEKY
jgi:hypothetical protein